MGKLGLGCIGILVVLLVILGISFAGTYNRLVTLGQDVDKSWAEVENQYQRRADLVPNLVSTVQGAANFEKDTLTAVTEARASVGRATITPGQAPTDPEALARFQAAQDQLGSALQRLLVVVRALSRAARRTRTSATCRRSSRARRTASPSRAAGSTSRRRATTPCCKRFPTNLLAGLFGFKEKPYFKAITPGAEQAPKVQFDFGKPTPAPAQ